MGTIVLEKGQYLVRTGELVNNVYILLKGSVWMETKNDRFLWGSGSIIGLLDTVGSTYVCSYKAEETSTLAAYPYHGVGDYHAIFEAYPKYQYAFVHGAIIQCHSVLERYEKLEAQIQEYHKVADTIQEDYHSLCERHGVSPSGVPSVSFTKHTSSFQRVEEWERAYNHAFAKKDQALIKEMYASDLPLCVGEIQHASDIMQRSVIFMQDAVDYLAAKSKILMNDQKKDYFALLFELRKKVAETGENQMDVATMMEDLIAYIQNAKAGEHFLFHPDMVAKRVQEYNSFEFEALQGGTMEDTEIFFGDEEEVANTLELQIEEEEEESTDCLETILSYAGKSEEEIDQIRKEIEAFRELPDPFATDDDTRRMRRELTKMYFEVYEAALFRSFQEDQEEMDEILMMFFQFGFMDVKLAGEENANALYEIADQLFHFQSPYVFTIYQWLRSIYLGEREPSRNEFDLDYTQNLREQIKTGQITREQAAAKEQDLEAKVRFEINNFFQMNNRTTYGRLSTYCPILREEEMIRSVEEMLVSVDKLGEALNTVRRVDFSCFYRDMLVSDEEKNLPRMEIKIEVMPEIVLMPTVGTRAMMWQEIGNQSRLSPARFTFPIFTPSDVTDMMIESCGRYRWEICRKIQGMRWNDIRENSLTAEYCDYLQFYRKNRDLTNEAREKVKSALQKGKNNYREVFVRDYVNWIKFEARGSMRLNKVARSILFRYCPLAKPRRRQRGESPGCREMIERYEILTQKEKEKVEKIFDKYEKSGGELLPEMKQYLTYFEL